MKTQGNISTLAAALKVLQDAGTPLHYREITSRILAAGLWHTTGKTPAATINARLSVDTARKDLLKSVKAMPPGDFEDLIGRLLAAIGFEEVQVTSRSRDGGIDVRGTLVVGDVIRTRLAVQVKRWRHNIQSPVIQQVRGSLGAHEQGLVIATSDFSKGARQEAERHDATPVGLMNGEQLVALLVENEIGVSKTPLQLIQLGESLGVPEQHSAQ
jgi:restriction system protein